MNKIYVVTILAACLRFFGGYTIQTYLAIFFGRRFGKSSCNFLLKNISA